MKWKATRSLHKFCISLFGVILPLTGLAQVMDTQVLTNQPAMIKILSLEDSETGYRYDWSFPRASLKTIPKWSPTESEAPFSPYKAVTAATNYLCKTLPKSPKFKVISISLEPCNVRSGFNDKDLNDIWAYQIDFDIYMQPNFVEKKFCNVLVLMDGTVVKSIATPLK
jgi:hypothetical protein